jgi:riboflavin biosynthesis pyrimidine reductase
LVQKLAKEGTKSRKFKRESVWVMGGPMVRGAMIQLGVVERVELVMVPKLINDGIRLWSFGPPVNSNDEKQDVKLELIECRSYENGVVGLSYSVVNEGSS